MSSVYFLEYIRPVIQLLPHASRSFLGKFSWRFRCFSLTVEVMSFPRVRFALYGSHDLRLGERGAEFSTFVLLYPPASTETGYSRLPHDIPQIWRYAILLEDVITSFRSCDISKRTLLFYSSVNEGANFTSS